MKKFIKIFLTLIFTAIIYYFLLPPLNLSSPLFWFFILMIVSIYLFISICTIPVDSISKLINYIHHKEYKTCIILFSSIFVIALLILIIDFINTPIFKSKSYYERITITDGNFSDDVTLVDFNNLALLDKDSSVKLGDRVMGQMTDLVSQFDVSSLYTQINYNNTIVRVTPLEYSGLIKYFTNHKQGVKGYITVNSVTGESSLTRLDKGMKYMPSAILNEDLYRKLRFSYPTEIFGEISFEIDEEGNPYWIAQTIKYTAVGLKKEISGIVILDPITGDCKKYKVEDVPTWVDHVYSADLIIEQVNSWGSYKNGFLNSIFGQKEVVMTTEGYNYLAMNDDVYLYTGITSVVQDESNIGFILTNLRTKETKFYNVAGAEEYSAMASAEGTVQQMSYTSTFPLIINLNGKPTYLMSLKDNAGLVKMYAFVDYTDYQKVSVTDSSEGIIKAAKNYLGEDLNVADTIKDTIKISSISTAVLDGTTYYYLKTEDDVYKASIKVSENKLPFIKIGDTIEITYKEDEINEIIKIED
jgi:hypothetical protein